MWVGRTVSGNSPAAGQSIGEDTSFWSTGMSLFQLQDFLIIAKSFMKGERGRLDDRRIQYQFLIPSVKEVLLNRMDPVAIDSVEAIPRMKYLH